MRETYLGVCVSLFVSESHLGACCVCVRLIWVCVVCACKSFCRVLCVSEVIRARVYVYMRLIWSYVRVCAAIGMNMTFVQKIAAAEGHEYGALGIQKSTSGLNLDAADPKKRDTRTNMELCKAYLVCVGGEDEGEGKGEGEGASVSRYPLRDSHVCVVCVIR